MDRGGSQQISSKSSLKDFNVGNVTAGNIATIHDKLEAKYKLQLEVAEENVRFLEKKETDDQARYNEIITSMYKDCEDHNNTLKDKDKKIHHLKNQIVGLDVPARSNENFYQSLKSYNHKYLIKNKVFRLERTVSSMNLVNQGSANPSKVYYHPGVSNAKNLSQEEFDLYSKILSDTKFGLNVKQEKDTAIGSLSRQVKKKDIQIKKDDMTMCKYRININDKINSMDTLKKQNHSLYLELQKIREKELQDEQDLWRNEVWLFFFFFVNLIVGF